MKISVFLDGANFFYMQKEALRWFADPKRILIVPQKTVSAK
jgi:hypothetical protein